MKTELTPTLTNDSMTWLHLAAVDSPIMTLTVTLCLVVGVTWWLVNAVF